MIVLSSFRARLLAYERDLAAEALTATKGAVVAASRLCGLHQTQMRRILRRHGLQGLLAHNHGRGVAKGGNAAWRALGDA